MKTKLTPEQQRRADTLVRMTPQEWDAICKCCGICCLVKVNCCVMNSPKENAVVIKTSYLNRCCPELDTQTQLCSVYSTRRDVIQYCKKVTMNVILAGRLPDSCGYVEYIFGPAPYPARVDFNQVRPVADGDFEKMSEAEIQQAIIPESIKWNERRR